MFYLSSLEYHAHLCKREHIEKCKQQIHSIMDSLKLEPLIMLHHNFARLNSLTQEEDKAYLDYIKVGIDKQKLTLRQLTTLVYGVALSISN